MTAKADLERRVERLKDRIQKAGEDSERPLSPDRVRVFRKRLKRTQRKLAKDAAVEAKKAVKETPAEVKSVEAKPAEAKPAEAKPAEEEPAETGNQEEERQS
jgi:hypothetical protein